MSAAAVTVCRQQVEDFLYAEAALLDAWRLDDWLLLFDEDAKYEVPCNDAVDGDPARDLMLIDDNYARLAARVARLNSRHAHREFPHSRTRRLLSNVRILGAADDEVMVTANFIVFRGRNGRDVFYVGRYEYVLRRSSDGLKIRHRKAVLDQESLDPHGKISIIL